MRRVRSKKAAVPATASSEQDSLPLETGELGETLRQVTKRYGDNSVRTASMIYQPDRIPFGIFTLDYAMLGGAPVSRVITLVGERSAGKSSVASKLISQAQRLYPDQTPVVIDTEGSFESTWAAKLGVDISSLPVIDCETGEMAIDIADAVVGSLETSLVIVDSIAALVPMKEQSSSAEDQFMGLQARLIGSFIRRVTSSLIHERKRGHNVTLLLLNQYRMKIGFVMGDPRTEPGGKSIEFAASVQIAIKNKELAGKDEFGGDAIVSNEHAFTIKKNKLNGGPRTGEFVLVRSDRPDENLQAGDIDDAPVLLSFAKRLGLYSGGGKRWTLSFDDYSMEFAKASEAIDVLRTDQELFWALRTYLIRDHAAKLGMPDEFIERIV